MTASRWERVRTLFEACLERDEADRFELLDSEAEPSVRNEVAALLDAHETEDDAFLEPPGTGSKRAPEAAQDADLEDTSIAGYRIVARVGSGGMGAVFEAIQDHPHRRVALKTMGEGLLSPTLARRFRQESEILARLSHPNIAQVFAAGIHVEGEGPRQREVPWFAMEYVDDATPLVEFAEQRSLGTRARVELFLSVCEAVHHGHEKGVIHRDLKPGNILVDATGTPKVIDFGVARATDADLVATTVHTQSSEFIGTLQYMSPEQIEGNAQGLDARSDVYSLGVVLYELLCRRPPYDLKGLSMPAAARIIRTERPHRPGHVRAELAGALEWIPLRALEKEPARRYPTALALADDLRRFLRHETVEARPPSLAYRARIFARRNRTFVMSAIAITLVLAGALVRVSIDARKAEAARGLAEEEAAKARAANDLLVHTLTPLSIDGQEQDLRVSALLRLAAAELENGSDVDAGLRAQLGVVLGRSFAALGLAADSIAHLEATRDLYESHPELNSEGLGEVYSELGNAYLLAGRIHDAEAALMRGYELRAEVFEAGSPELDWTRYDIARLRIDQGRYGEAEAILDELLQRQGSGVLVRSTLANVYRLTGRKAEAAALLLEVLEDHENDARTGYLKTLPSRLVLANTLLDLGDGGEAEKILRDAEEQCARVLGDSHPRTLGVRNNLAGILQARGDIAGAEAMFRDLLEQQRNALGEQGRATHRAKHNLGQLLTSGAKKAEGLRLLNEALVGRRESLGIAHPDTIVTGERLAASLCDAGESERGLMLLDELVEACVERFGETHPQTLRVRRSRGWQRTLDGRDAREELRRVCRDCEAKLGALDPLFLDASRDLGRALAMAEQFAEAREVLETALERMKKALGEESPITMATACDLGRVYLSENDLEAGETLLVETLDAQREQLGADSRDQIVTVGLLLKLYLALGRNDEAEPMLRESLRLQRLHHGRVSMAALQEASALAVFLSDNERLKEAEPFYRECRDISREMLPESRAAAECEFQLGNCLLGLKRYTEAVTSLRAGVEGLERMLGPQDARTLEALRALEVAEELAD